MSNVVLFRSWILQILGYQRNRRSHNRTCKFVFCLVSLIKSSYSFFDVFLIYKLKDSIFSRGWIFIKFLFLIMYTIYLPIRLGFDALHSNENIFIWMEVIPNAILIANMFFIFNTGMLIQQFLIT